MDEESALKRLKDRKRTNWRPCLIPWAFTKDKKEDRLMRQGTDRITKEFDVIRYIKRQMVLDVALKALFTKTDRYLMRNNKSFVLHKAGDSDSSSTDWEPKSLNNYKGRLLGNVFGKTSSGKEGSRVKAKVRQTRQTVGRSDENPVSQTHSSHFVRSAHME